MASHFFKFQPVHSRGLWCLANGSSCKKLKKQYSGTNKDQNQAAENFHALAKQNTQPFSNTDGQKKNSSGEHPNNRPPTF